MQSSKRLVKEYQEILESPIENCNLSPCEDNIHRWEGTLIGPNDTPYEGGIFNISITFPKEYPYMPPRLYFKTNIYHPNISSTGVICLDILKDQWSPVLKINKVMLSLSSLLSDPNPDDPLVPEIAKEMINNYSLFKVKARQYTKDLAF
jgi:ubiquitin-conjugating enzyme E2 D